MKSTRNLHRLGAISAMILLAGTLGATASPARPTVAFSTYLGGSADEENVAIAIDAAGNVYVAGDTLSSDFPVVAGSGQHGHLPEFPHDIFLTKFGPDGSPLWSTYTGTEWDDHVTAMTLDPQGNPLLVGWVDVGEEIQVLAGSFRADGSSGGVSIPFFSPNQGRAYAVAAGSSGTFLVSISDHDFAGPHAPGLHAIVVQIGSGTGARAAYFAGDCIAWPTGVAVDTAGFVYITGRTSCATFPRVHAAQGAYGGGDDDAFVMKLNPVDFSIVYSTYLGGSADDSANAIAVDPAGNAYVSGSTRSTDFPLHKPLQRSAGGTFLTKLAPTGAIVYSTYLTGVGGGSLAVDSQGAAFLLGYTSSAGPFVARVDPKGKKISNWSYGPGYAIAINAAHDVAVGGTAGPGLPTVHAFQPANRGGSDAIVTRVVDSKKGKGDPRDGDDD